MEDPPEDRILRLTPLVLLSLCLLWVTSIAATRLRDPDDWWQLRLGSELLHQHSLATPPWSSYADQAWVPTEPLPEMVSALTQRWLGYPGLAWVFGMSLFAMTLCLYVLNRQRASTLPAVVVTAAALVPLYGSMTPRPQVISFALLAVTLVAWTRTADDLRPRWWLVPLFWLWSLCHGFWFVGVAYGFVGLAAVVLSRRATVGQLTRLAALAVASAAVVLLNPVGPRLFEQPFLVNSAARFITEWQHPSPLSAGPLGAWLLILATLVLWGLTRRGMRPLPVLLLLSAAFWAWYAERTVAVSAIVSAPVLAEALHSVVSRQGDGADRGSVGGPGRLEWRFVGVTLALGALGLAALVPGVAREPGDVPLGLDRTLDRVPAGSGVYTEYVLGGWIAWRHPDLDQFIDGLATPYSTQHYLDFFQIQGTTPGWYALMRRDRLTVAVVLRGSPVATGLARHGWRLQGTDQGYVLLTAPGVLRPG